MSIQEVLGVAGFGLALLALFFDWRRWRVDRGGLRVAVVQIASLDDRLSGQVRRVFPAIAEDDKRTYVTVEVTNHMDRAASVTRVGYRRWLGGAVTFENSKYKPNGPEFAVGLPNIMAAMPKSLPVRIGDGETVQISAAIPDRASRVRSVAVWDASRRCHAAPRSELNGIEGIRSRT